MLKALVVGNGESRKHINLQLLKKDFKIIGCNGLHRDLKVDHLICCDRRMVEEAIKNPDIGDTKIYVRDSWYHYYRKILKNKNIQKLPSVPSESETKKDQPDHWGSGCYAILLAANSGFKQITLLGFDLYPINQKVNNIYKDTQNYASSNSQPVDYSYWVYQTAQIFKYFKTIQFNILNKPDWQLPTEWYQPNVKFTNLLQLEVDSINSSVVQ